MSLEEYRRKLDEIDDKIAELIAERVEICRRIGKYKAKEDLPTYDPDREREVLERVDKRGRELGLDAEERKSLKDVFRLIIKRSKEIQDG